jgi:hypothetical protein
MWKGQECYKKEPIIHQVKKDSNDHMKKMMEKKKINRSLKCPL